MSSCVTATTRKARRKEERERKKQNKRAHKQQQQSSNKKAKTTSTTSATEEQPKKNHESKRPASNNKPERSVGKKARRTPTFHADHDPYANLPPEVAAAMRRDDDEIADLENKLGISGGRNRNNNSSSKDRLNKEYATKECFGNDFGNFLDDLDKMVRRVMAPSITNDEDNDSDSSSEDESSSDGGNNTSDSENVEKETAE